MMYEISRETFKQRLLTPLNFKIIHIGTSESFSAITLKNIQNITYDSDFSGKLAGSAEKNDNILLFTTTGESDNSAKTAAEELAKNGYNFVYFYKGSIKDNILDKGLN